MKRRRIASGIEMLPITTINVRAMPQRKMSVSKRRTEAQRLERALDSVTHVQAQENHRQNIETGHERVLKAANHHGIDVVVAFRIHEMEAPESVKPRVKWAR